MIGRLNDDGTVTDASNNLIGGIGLDWYERVKPKKQPVKQKEVPSIGDPVDDKTKEGEGSGNNQYRRSLNIA